VDHDDYNPNTPRYPHDPGRSRQILESMGFELGKDDFYYKDGKALRLELLASSITVAGQPAADRDGEVIRNQLESVGIRVDLRNMEQTTTDAKVRNWDFQLAISGHGGIMGDPKILNEMISEEYAAGSVNSARFQDNKELLKLLETQMLEMDPAKRRAMVYRIQEIFAEELPSICLYYPETLAAYDPKKGIRWFYTKGGISKGIPIAQNKLSLIR
jgi:peptide/nickel transport system substrate-binding protein